MKFAQAEACDRTRVAQCGLEVDQSLENRSLISGVRGPALPAKTIEKRKFQRLRNSLFSDRTAAAADANVCFGSDSAILSRRRACRSESVVASWRSEASIG